MKYKLHSTLLVMMIISVLMTFSCKENNTKNQIETTPKKPQKVEEKKPETTKILTWKLGDHDLRAYFDKFKKYGSFEGNAGLNTSHFIDLVSKDCKITSHYDTKNLKQDFTQTPSEYANILGRIAFTTKITETILVEVTYEIKDNKANLSYVSGYLEEETNDYFAIKRELTVEIIDDDLKASSMTVTMTDATQAQIDKINQLLSLNQETIKKPKRQYMNPSGQTYFASKSSITTDGKFVIFRSPPNIEGKVYLLDTETQKTTLLDKVPGKNFETQYFTPDNKHVFVSSKIDGIRNHTIKIGETKLVKWSSKEEDCNVAAFSPDGSKALIVSRSQGGFLIEEANSDGTEFRKVIENHQTFVVPKYSSESNYIVLQSFNFANGEMTYEIKIADNEGKLTKNSVQHGDSIEPVSLLESKDRLYFVKNTPNKKLCYLNLKDNKTTVVESIKDWEVVDSQASSCGRYFFFVSMANNYEHELYLMDLEDDKPQPKKLTNTEGMLNDFCISYDGQWIVYTIESDNGDKMYIMQRDGSNNKLIKEFTK